MIQTALMVRIQKLIIGPPPIVVKPSEPVLAQYGSGLLESAARQNVINRDFCAQTDPKPLEIPADSPARLIHPVHLAAPHRDPKLLIGGRRLDAQSHHRPAECAAIQFQTVAYFQHPRGAFMRNAQFLVQVRTQGQRLRSDLNLRRAQRVGGLQGMTALYALPTTLAMSDLNVEAPHNRLLDDVFLKLGPRFIVNRWSAATLRFRRQRYGNLFVHALWEPAGAPASRNRPRSCGPAASVPSFSVCLWRMVPLAALRIVVLLQAPYAIAQSRLALFRLVVGEFRSLG